MQVIKCAQQKVISYYLIEQKDTMVTRKGRGAKRLNYDVRCQGYWKKCH